MFSISEMCSVGGSYGWNVRVMLSALGKLFTFVEAGLVDSDPWWGRIGCFEVLEAGI